MLSSAFVSQPSHYISLTKTAIQMSAIKIERLLFTRHIGEFVHIVCTTPFFDLKQCSLRVLMI